MNMCAGKNNGWAENNSFKYAGGIGASALSNTPTPQITIPSIPPASPSPTPAAILAQTNGGICTCNVICNISTPACKTMAQTANQWDALKNSVDAMLAASLTPAASTGTTAETTSESRQNQVDKSTSTLYLVMGGASLILVVTAVVLLAKKKS